MQTNKRNRGRNWIAVALAGLYLCLGGGAALAVTTNNVTWSGGAGSGTPGWDVDANWLGGVAPTNPTVATVYYKTNGQAVVGVLDADRTVGSINIGDSGGTIFHTLNMGGHLLTAGNITTPGTVNYTFAVTNGTLLVGSVTNLGNITIGNHSSGKLIVNVGAQFSATNVNTITIGYPGWGDAGYGNLDLRGATVAGGMLVMSNLYLYTGHNEPNSAAIYLDSNTAISTIWVKQTLLLGQIYGGGDGYIGNPGDNYRLPPNVSFRVGSDLAHRADMTVGYGTAYRRAMTAKLVASGGGTFTGYLNNLLVMRFEMNSDQNIAVVYGTLDLGAMSSCAINANVIKIAADDPSPSSLDNQRGAMYLPQGVVTAGVVVAGSTTGVGYGILSLSNTMFTVTNSFTINTTGTNVISLGATPNGLDVQGAFTDGGGNIRVNFLAAPDAGATNWAIRITGNARSTLNSMVGSGRLSSTGTFSGKKAGVLYDGTYTYYAMVDNSVPFPPVAVAYAQRTYEITPAGQVVIGTNDINNGSYDPSLRPITLTISTNGGPDMATLTFGATGDYMTTLKVTAGSDSATDTCTVHVVSLNPGATNNLTWNGAASTLLMDRREWFWSGNWVGNAPPTNPTTATLSYATLGQNVTGRLDAARTIGGFSLGQASATANHTIDLCSNTLTVAGTIADVTSSTATGFKLTNGTLRVGSSSATGSVLLTSGGTTLTVCPGAKWDPFQVGTIQLANAAGSGWGTPTAILDLRGAQVVGGVLRASNLLLHNGGGGNSSYLYLDSNTTVNAIEVSNSMVIGRTAGQSTCYIGNPVDQKLPPGISVRIGTSPAQRGALEVLHTVSYIRDSTASLVASGGGTFTAYMSNLTVVLHAATSEQGNVNPQTGILDLSKMASCAIDTLSLSIAPDSALLPTNTDNLVGTLSLPPGSVVAGNVVVGGPTNRGVATLQTSNTTFAVTNSIILHKTARMTLGIGSQSCGLVISNAANTALSLATATNGALRIAFRSAPAAAPFYGLSWQGDHIAALQSLQTAGTLVVDSSGLAPKTATIFKTGGVTYIGLPPPAGSLFLLR